MNVDPALVSRHSRVRAQLLDAAYALMGEKAFDLITVADIVAAAGVGVGSFYNHFKTKEELARAAFTYRIEEYGREMAAIASSAPDVAAATCLIYRSFIDRAARDKAWAAFVVQLEPSFRLYDRLIRAHARVGLAGAARAFDLPDIDTAITIKNAALLEIVRRMVAGDISAQNAHRSSYYALRMIGISHEEAELLANLSMGALRRRVMGDTPARTAKRPATQDTDRPRIAP